MLTCSSMGMNRHTDIKEIVFKKTSMESYNNKWRKFLKIHFFINLRTKIIFLRAQFCVIKQNFENIVEYLWKSPKRLTYSLTNNISHDHICYSMCNVNMLIIITTYIIVHDVLVFYGFRSHRKLINLFWIATRRPLREELYNLSLTYPIKSNECNSSYVSHNIVSIKSLETRTNVALLSNSKVL